MSAHTSSTAGQPIPVTLIPGDGIGPEITRATKEVLAALGAPFLWDEQKAGVHALEDEGTPLPDATLRSLERTRLALKAPLATPSGTGFRSVNVTLRQKFDLYANIRPARTLLPRDDLRRYDRLDIVLIRENIEGYYAARDYYLPQGDDPQGMALSAGYTTRAECERIVTHAFDHALAHGRRKVTLVHKANILKLMSGLFLETGRKVAARYEGRIACDERIVDACAMQLCLDPSQFDVIVTTNLFGDILSDQISGLTGGLGLAPGANIGKDMAIFEAVHGSAPDIAGQNRANPTALLLAGALMLDHTNHAALATRLRTAIIQTLQNGTRTGDLGGTATTDQFTRAVINALERP
ncbi:NAD-dependent isocitrate dehydrogenase [Parasaccharibacter sp. TMW 2.1888]|uniref:isocitrate/isopropylmalate dehydrogenase family protein n=1 Tax=Parasaccharibacter sp. TMW 2.1888 TaxID=2268025 RepID=UPI00206D87A0|nr:isocitrate/isopropylmalate family dehydrogenase [Parasaccharibacter sp. TMW 2.1888]UPO80054.1 NAD-dependent isocitrate dehydrogenase [Parasaccharibacter sp. TMW 2.1888]